MYFYESLLDIEYHNIKHKKYTDEEEEEEDMLIE